MTARRLTLRRMFDRLLDSDFGLGRPRRRRLRPPATGVPASHRRFRPSFEMLEDRITPSVPSVMMVSPTSGPAAGGTSVTISGEYFTGASTVAFGSTPAVYSVVSDLQITATAPAEAAGTANITVTNADGTSLTGSQDQYTYDGAGSTLPVVSDVLPDSGPASGGTSVTINGQYFTAASAVAFGAAASSFTIVSDTQIDATAPAGPVGTVDITVTTPQGASARGLQDQYTFTAAAPTVSAVTPNSGSTAGGNSVTISGQYFSGATEVQFGGNAAMFTVVSDTEIDATAPAEAAGTVGLTVTTSNGTSATGSQDQYLYLPVVTVTNPGTQNDNDNEWICLPISATDSAGDAMTFSATGLPAGLSICSTNGKISGLIGSQDDNGSPYNITVAAEDDNDLDAVGSAQFCMFVDGGPTRPVNVGPSTPGVVAVGAAQGTYTGMTASSNGPDGQSVTYSLRNAGTAFAINGATGVITVATCPGAGNYTFTVVATAQDDTTAQARFTVQVLANQNPPGNPTATPAYGVVGAEAPEETNTGLTVQSAGANSYALTNNPNGIFAISNTGVVTVANGGNNLTFTDAPYYQITVVGVSAAGLSSAQASFYIYPTLYGGATPAADSDLGPEGDTVCQGAYSDCWLISALAEEAHDDPEGVAGWITPVDDEPLQFSVQFPGWSAPIDVNFDDISNEVWQNLSVSNGFRSALIEVAYEVGGCGELVASLEGSAIPILTGNGDDGYDFGHVCPSTIYNLIASWRNTSYGIVVTDTPGDVGDGLVPNHCYSVLGDFMVDGEPYVDLRNPWGGDNNGIFTMPLVTYMDDFYGLDYEVPGNDEINSPNTLLTDDAPRNGADDQSLTAVPVNATGTISTITPPQGILSRRGFVNAIGADALAGPAIPGLANPAMQNATGVSSNAPTAFLTVAPTGPAIPTLANPGIQNATGIFTNPPSAFLVEGSAYGALSILPPANNVAILTSADGNAASAQDGSSTATAGFSEPRDVLTNHPVWIASAAADDSTHDADAAELAAANRPQGDAEIHPWWDDNGAGFEFPPPVIAVWIDVDVGEGFSGSD